MVLWILFAAMTVLAALVIVVPLFRKEAHSTSAPAHDVAIYKDQLAELDKDLENGLITADEAEAARTEISRRLLHASDNVVEKRQAASPLIRNLALALVVIGVPVISGVMYFSVGAPDIPDQPLQSRQVNPHPNAEVDKMIAGTEAYLNENRGNGNAWAMLGQAYLRARRGADAITAFQKAIELLGANAQLETGLGAAYMFADNGEINAEAKAAFERAVALDPNSVEPRFFLAVGLNREKRYGEAVKAWEAIMKSADPSKPWFANARHELIVARKGAGLPVDDIPPLPKAPPPPPATAEAPGPSADDVAAARDMSAGDRQAMIEGMVSNLAERLDEQGGSAEEWIRLMRAYMVLKRQDDAKAAAEKALAAYRDDAGAQARIKDAANGLGIAL